MGDDNNNIVKVITTQDLYNEVLGLREDLQTMLSEHKNIPDLVKQLRSDVDTLNRLRWQLTGAALAAGPIGAWLVKITGG